MNETIFTIVVIIVVIILAAIAYYLEVREEKQRKKKEKENNLPVFLWLDDYRDPHDKINKDRMSFDIQYNIENNNFKIVWVKNYEEFVDYIKNNKNPIAISFDHDLHFEHYVPKKYWDNYELSETYQRHKRKSYIHKTGWDCLKYYMDYIRNTNDSLAPIWVHSDNPVGKNNMTKLFNNYKHKKQEEE